MPERSTRDPFWWHLLAILVVAVWFESLFIHHGINPLDGGWPVYAAMRMHHGGTLYDDISWAFPPGHAIPAWIGYAIEPPGIVPTRYIYAAFCVGLSLALYVLARRLMPSSYALLATGIVTVGAPSSHLMHYLFAYRYLVLVVLGLLLFARRLDTGDRRWIFAAGLMTGIAVFFRLTPAFCLGVGIGVAVMTIDRDWRSWLRDWGWYAAGLLCVFVPVLAWFQASVGVPWLYHEVVERPLHMLQAMPWPDVVFPSSWARHEIRRWFEAVQFRTHWFLYAFYLVGLGWQWQRAVRRREPFDQTLLVAVVVFGCVLFVRSLGRSDRSHLDSAIVPVCVLLAYGLHLGLSRYAPGWKLLGRRWAAEATVCTALFVVWMYLGASDTFLWEESRGTIPLASTNHQIRTTHHNIDHIDNNVFDIQTLSSPGDILLDMSAAPVFHVLADRIGPGYHDIVMPGTFISEQEQLDFITHLEAKPPAVVLWPRDAFDDTESRSVFATAPLVAKWVQERYVPYHRKPAGGRRMKYYVLRPRKSFKAQWDDGLVAP